MLYEVASATADQLIVASPASAVAVTPVGAGGGGESGVKLRILPLVVPELLLAATR
jgi:hypothetical protein